MTNRLYVATDRDGVQHRTGTPVTWKLPTLKGSSWEKAEATSGTPLVLFQTRALIDALDELIFVASPINPVTTVDNADGTVTTPSAILEAGTSWDVAGAARFALDCAEHVAQPIGDIALPGGTTVNAVINDARQLLDKVSDSAEQRLGRLARMSAARRLRRDGTAMSALASELLSDDTLRDIDALDDPAYATTAAVVDAVLSAVDAIRHFVIPRYFDSRTESADQHSDSEPLATPSIVTTPWGPIAFGVEHLNPYSPSWVAARDAAARSTDAAIARGGVEAGKDERQWQAARLEHYVG